MIRGPRTPRLDDEVQVKCWVSLEGHRWMPYYDELPPPIRQRLRNLPINLCPACLVTIFEPRVREQHPNYGAEKALQAGIDMMLSELKKRG